MLSLLSLLLPLLALLHHQHHGGVGAQSIRTVNGSLVMTVPGATLTLTTDASTCGPGNGGQGGQGVQIGDSVQAQLGNLYLILNTTLAIVNGLQGALLQEQNRARDAETSIATGLGSERTRAMNAEASLTTTTTSLSSSVAALGPAVDARMNSSLTIIGAAVGAQLAASQVIVNQQASTQVVAEQQRATAAEASVAASLLNISSLFNIRAISAELSITANLTGEINRALGVESSLSMVVFSNNQRAVNAEQSLNVTLAAQISTLVYNELQRALAAEGSISMTVLSTALQYNTRALNAEQSINTRLVNEVSRAVDADNSFTVVMASINSRAVITDQSLAQQISNEISRAVFVESTLATTSSQALTAAQSLAALPLLGGTANPSFSSATVNGRLLAAGSTAIGMLTPPQALLHLATGDLIMGNRRFMQIVSAFNTQSSGSRILTITSVNVGECYYKLVMPYLSPYQGSGYSLAVIELAAFPFEARVSTITNAKYGPNTGGLTISVAAAVNQISITFAFSPSNYRIYGFIEAWGDNTFSYAWSGTNVG